MCDSCTYLRQCLKGFHFVHLPIKRFVLIRHTTTQFTSCQKYNQCLSLHDLIVHGVQRSSDARAKEGQENTTEVDPANEKVTVTKFGVDKEHEKETSIVEEACSPTGRMEVNTWSSDPVTLHNKANHQFPAKTRETKAWIESKVVGGDGSHERSKKESITSTEERRK